MTGFLSSPWAQKIIAYLLTWLWGKASDAVKDVIAKQKIEAHVKKTMESYEALVLKFDELKDAGQLTEEKKKELRDAKIKLETDLINGIG